MSKVRELQHVVWQEGKYYIAQCLNVDVSSFGRSQKEALENLEEALELYFEDEPRAKVVVIKKPVLVKQPLRALFDRTQSLSA